VVEGQALPRQLNWGIFHRGEGGLRLGTDWMFNLIGEALLLVFFHKAYI